MQLTHLLKEGITLQVAIVRDKLRALAGELLGDVLGDGPALKDKEAVVVEDGDLAKRLLLAELGRFVLSNGEVDGHQLVGDVLLFEGGEDPLSAGGGCGTVHFDGHVGPVDLAGC